MKKKQREEHLLAQTDKTGVPKNANCEMYARLHICYYMNPDQVQFFTLLFLMANHICSIKTVRYSDIQHKRLNHAFFTF